jgi:hypothetical protein
MDADKVKLSLDLLEVIAKMSLAIMNEDITMTPHGEKVFQEYVDVVTRMYNMLVD